MHKLNQAHSNETVRMLLHAHNEIVKLYQDIEILFGVDTAKNLDRFARRVILCVDGCYAKIMTRLEGLLLLGVSSVDAANVICNQYNLDSVVFIDWEEE